LKGYLEFADRLPESPKVKEVNNKDADGKKDQKIGKFMDEFASYCKCLSYN